jgi:arylsulfatase A-like enzyme
MFADASDVAYGHDHHIAGIGSIHEVIRPGFEGAPGYEGFLNDRVVTVTELLRDSGYRTIISGKWHLGETLETAPIVRGFKRSFALLPGGADHFGGGPIDEATARGAIYMEDDHFIRKLPGDFYSSDYFTTRLIEYLGDEAGADRPFLSICRFLRHIGPCRRPTLRLRSTPA